MTAIGVIDVSAVKLRWMDQGSCRDVEPEAWYSYADTDVEYAKSFCRSCPVVAVCREWALDTEQEHGVWGGLSERDRHRIHAEKRGKCSRGHSLANRGALANGGCARCTVERNAASYARSRAEVRRYPCPVCTRPIGLVGDGNLGRHKNLDTRDWCAGTGMNPEKELGL